jgi:hypothetical protein
MILHKTLSVKEALGHIAYSIYHRELSNKDESFEGDITCEMNEDGTVDVYFVNKSDQDDKN